MEQTSAKVSSAEAKKKKAKYTMAKIIVILCAVLCVVLTVFELGVTYRTMKAVEVDGTEYSVAEYNWLYTNSVYEIYNSYYMTYGEMASYIFNPSGNLSEMVYNQETGETWAEYVKEYTDKTIVEMTALLRAGEEAGHVLDEEFYERCDEEWNALATTAASNGYSVSDYAEMSYGRGVNEKVFREMYERYYYAFTYAESVSDSFEFNSEEKDAYYEENAEDFDTVTYNYYFVSSSAKEGEDADAIKAEAKATAEAVLSGEKEVEFTEAGYALKAATNSVYADWVFDEARTAGDKEMFEGETGYYVVEFVEENDLHHNMVNVRHILVTAADSTEEAKAEALEKAEKYLAEWKELGETEENFATVAGKYSEDSSAEYGGLIENIYKGRTVEGFEDWCFDPARKTGDTDIVYSQYGYHVMYFCGEGAEYYDYIVEAAMRNENINTYLDGIVEGLEASDLFGAKYVGKHFG